MNTTHLPTFDQLRQRMGGTLVALADQALESRRVVEYLASLGFKVSTSTEVFAAIEHLEGEEELAAYRCIDGVAVSHASDGWWLLLTAGGLEVVSANVARQPSQANEDRS